MFEDFHMVRINDSIEVFSQVVKKEEFREAPIFLICNKFDEFTEKIRETDCFTKVFPEYIGDPHDPDKCAQYIVDKFLERAKPLTESRPIIVYRQVSLDSQQVIDNTLQMFKYISQNYYE
ncbi:G-protein alpha subunit [Histomonas meleagridis]|nr:G-protein alpha subunit [Histomonas meleagridis]